MIDNNEPPHAEGIRLAKQVALLAGCSRREAEWLIEAGAVRVDGAPVFVPQARVLPSQAVTIAPGARPAPIAPVTLLLHKPPGLRPDQTERLLAAEHRAADDRAAPPLPRQLAGQRCVAPLAAAAGGLMVFTQVQGVERRLVEDAALIEHEWMVEVDGALPEGALAQLAKAQLRASVSAARPGRTVLRIVLKGDRLPALMACCEAAGLRIAGMRRLRIGRVPLAALASGQWRTLLGHERF